MYKNKKVIITYGTYDMLHIGHLNLFQRAKALGDYLIVGVTSEDYDRSRGKLNVFQSTEERLEAIRKLDFVDKVIVETHKNQKAEDIVKYGVDIFAIGDDWVGKFDYLKKYCAVEYLPRTEGISSTLLREKRFNTVKIGIFGLGRDANRLIREVSFVSNCKIQSICGKDISEVEKFIASTNIEYGYSDYVKFLETNIDAVYIATPLKLHYKHIRMALEANKHVLCETPVVIGSEELKELFALAKKRKRLFLAALKTAFAPAFNALLDEIKKETIGEIKEVRGTFTSLYKERGFPENYIKNGATNLLMSYPSLLAHKIAGKSIKLSFFDQIDIDGGYDISNRVISIHEKGIIGISTVGIGMKSEGDAIISGEKGYVYIPAPWWLTKEFYIKFEDSHKEYYFEYEFEGDGLRYMIAEFVSLIQRGDIESQRLTQKDMLELNKIIVQYNKEKK